MNPQTQKIEDIITSTKWQFSWDRRMTYQKMRLFSYAYHNEIPKMFNVVLGLELYRVKDFLVSECYDSNEYKKAFTKIEEQFADKNSAKLFEKLAKYIRSFEEDFKIYVDNMPISYDNYDNEKLLKAYTDYCQAEHNISLPNWVLFVPFEDMITRTLKRTLEEELGTTDKIDQTIKYVSLPSKMTPLDLHNKALYEIALAPKENRDALLNAMTQKFICWGTFDVIYPVATKESFVKKLADISDLGEADLKKRLEEIDRKYTHQGNAAMAVLEQWKKNDYIYNLLNLYFHYANYKDWKNHYREESSYKLKILLEAISKKIDLSPEETAFLTEDETKEALTGKKSFKASEIHKRIEDSAFVFINGKPYVITDSETLNKIDTAISLSKSSEVKGMGAYPGKVKGLVRIIISSNDFNKLKDGDILVTSTTRPDFVPIMVKAAGFVTNEGGLLSHAAIVARELKKPCVIGTKTATKVFKDGDMVEVDADKGIVRIIK